jgi:hypothetical protein
MAKYKFDKVFEDLFIQTCNTSVSMSQAAQSLGMNYKTVCFHAKRLNCFSTNQSGKGISKPIKKGLTPLQDIFDGKYKTFQSHKLKKKILKEGYKKRECEKCFLEIWLNQPIPLELHHIDSNRYNNALENLQLLCPNCHALTENYRAKNIKNLSAHLETNDVEPLKFGEALTGNPEPSPETFSGKV